MNFNLRLAITVPLKIAVKTNKTGRLRRAAFSQGISFEAVVGSETQRKQSLPADRCWPGI
jgi:hypothetical protein